MITLYSFGPAFGLPDPSPFVMKAEVLLKMSGLSARSGTSEYSGQTATHLAWFPFPRHTRDLVCEARPNEHCTSTTPFTLLNCREAG